MRTQAGRITLVNRETGERLRTIEGQVTLKLEGGAPIPRQSRPKSTVHASFTVVQAELAREAYDFPAQPTGWHARHHTGDQK